MSATRSVHMEPSAQSQLCQEAVPDDGPERAASPSDQPQHDEHVLAELLVEDVSIDGMCGVY